MNPSCIFHPYWSFINPTNGFPLFQLSSFQNYLYPDPTSLMNQTIKTTIISQKKSAESQNQLIFPERSINERRKTIKKTKEDKNFSYRYQDKDRNIYSNILKGFVIKLREDFHFQAKCQKDIKLFNHQFQLEEFIQFLDQNFQKTKTYISPTYMKKVLKNNEKKEASRYFAFLLSKYLREGFTLVLLGSQRIQKQSKILQMKKARELWALVYQKGEQGEFRSTD